MYSVTNFISSTFARELYPIINIFLLKRIGTKLFSLVILNMHTIVHMLFVSHKIIPWLLGGYHLVISCRECDWLMKGCERDLRQLILMWMCSPRHPRGRLPWKLTALLLHQGIHLLKVKPSPLEPNLCSPQSY